MDIQKLSDGEILFPGGTRLSPEMAEALKAFFLAEQKEALIDAAAIAAKEPAIAALKELQAEHTRTRVMLGEARDLLEKTLYNQRTDKPEEVEIYNLVVAYLLKPVSDADLGFWGREKRRLYAKVERLSKAGDTLAKNPHTDLVALQEWANARNSQ